MHVQLMQTSVPILVMRYWFKQPSGVGHGGLWSGIGGLVPPASKLVK